MQIEKRVFLLTGSNIEPRAKYLALADKDIEENIGKIVERSSIYESEPWGFEANTAFLNQVLIVITELTPLEVLKKIHFIEEKLGRVRKAKTYISRTIDIDILYFENEIIEADNLAIPHPRLHERRFTMVPLAEIAGNFIHPVLNKTNNELLQKLTDMDRVWKVEVDKSCENV
jgi:2-amino-4-hydroxy-6-hydroxymethyldihydropteridine diphosphokinase